MIEPEIKPEIKPEIEPGIKRGANSTVSIPREAHRINSLSPLSRDLEFRGVDLISGQRSVTRSLSSGRIWGLEPETAPETALETALEITPETEPEPERGIIQIQHQTPTHIRDPQFSTPHSHFLFPFF